MRFRVSFVPWYFPFADMGEMELGTMNDLDSWAEKVSVRGENEEKVGKERHLPKEEDNTQLFTPGFSHTVQLFQHLEAAKTSPFSR